MGRLAIDRCVPTQSARLLVPIAQGHSCAQLCSSELTTCCQVAASHRVSLSLHGIYEPTNINFVRYLCWVRYAGPSRCRNPIAMEQSRQTSDESRSSKPPEAGSDIGSLQLSLLAERSAQDWTDVPEYPAIGEPVIFRKAALTSGIRPFPGPDNCRCGSCRHRSSQPGLVGYDFAWPACAKTPHKAPPWNAATCGPLREYEETAFSTRRNNLNKARHVSFSLLMKDGNRRIVAGPGLGSIVEI